SEHPCGEPQERCNKNAWIDESGAAGFFRFHCEDLQGDSQTGHPTEYARRQKVLRFRPNVRLHLFPKDALSPSFRETCGSAEQVAPVLALVTLVDRLA